VSARRPVVVIRILACFGALFCAAFWAKPVSARSGGTQTASAAPASASIGNVDVSARADGVTITIDVSAVAALSPSRASNPDRLIFDFPGFELKGNNRHIPVNRGPVKELRISQFRVRPPVTRMVVESSEALDYRMKRVANGTVVIEIPFAKPGPDSGQSNAPSAEGADAVTRAQTRPQSGSPPPTPAETRLNLEKPQPAESQNRTETPPVQLELAPVERAGTRPAKPAPGPPGAYALMDKAKALKLDDLQPLEEKARAGDPEAQTLLALAYYSGSLLKVDDDEAMRLLHQAADRGYMAAEESLGMFAEAGVGREQRQPAFADALAWYHKAAQQGSMDAATDIALLYANGKGVPRDPAQAVVWFRKAADGGDGSAQYNLALMYERGEGVPQDYKEAVRWLTAAADQGLVPPLLALAELFLQPPNSSMTADTSKAIQYYEQAAAKGSATAQVTLGTIFSRGLQGKVDYAQAIEWYKKAADKGEPDGEFALGVSYALGHGAAVDYALARRWLTAAANQGQIEAQYDLAIICEQGNGAPPDRDLASHYYQMAADRGMAKAQYRFGLFLAKGASGSDRIAAYKWLTLAGDSIKESLEPLNNLKKSMNPQEIAQADQDVQYWRAAHGHEKR